MGLACQGRHEYLSVNWSYCHYDKRYMDIVTTSVKWSFITAKFCALSKKLEFRGGSIAMLVECNRY